MKNKTPSRLGIGALAAVVVAAPLAVAAPAAAAPGDPINFPSADFLTCLINLGVDTDASGDITEGEADAFVGAIDCSGAPWGYPSVNGIGFFQNVSTIDLTGIGIQDLSGFSGGTNGGGFDTDNPTAPSLSIGALTDLTLAENPLQNLGFLNGFTHITNLNLNDNTVLQDLTPVGTMTNLSTLRLSGASALEDISPVTQPLTVLDLSDRNFTWDISTLNVAALASINLSNTLVDDLTSLAGAAALSTVYLNDATALQDLSPLATSGVTQLFLDGATSLQDLSQLGAAIGQIVDLDIDNTGVVDLTSLAGAAALSNLYAANNGIQSIVPLNGLSINVLDLSGNLIEDASPLNSSATIGVLNLSSNPIIHSGFQVPANITSVSMRDTGLTNFDSFGVLPSVQTINVGDNNLTDLAPLSAFAGTLLELDFSENNVIDIQSLAALTNLTSINGADQDVAFADVQRTAAFANPVRGLAETPDLTPTDAAAGSYASGNITWNVAGTHTLTWNSAETLNGVNFTFSGLASQTATPYDIPAVVTGGFEMPWGGYMGLGALALLIAGVFGFVAYRKGLTA